MLGDYDYLVTPTKQELETLSQVENIDLYKILGIDYVNEVDAVRKKIDIIRHRTDSEYHQAFSILSDERLKFLYDRHLYPHGERNILKPTFLHDLEFSLAMGVKAMADNIFHIYAFSSHPVSILNSIRFLKRDVKFSGLYRGGLFYLIPNVSLIVTLAPSCNVLDFLAYPSLMVSNIIASNYAATYKSIFKQIARLPTSTASTLITNSKRFNPLLTKFTFNLSSWKVNPIEILSNLYYGAPYFLLKRMLFRKIRLQLKLAFIPDLPEQDNEALYEIREIRDKSWKFISSFKGISLIFLFALLTNPISVVEVNYINQLLLSPENRKGILELTKSLYQQGGIKIFFNGFLFNLIKEVIELFVF